MVLRLIGETPLRFSILCPATEQLAQQLAAFAHCRVLSIIRNTGAIVAIFLLSLDGAHYYVVFADSLSFQRIPARRNC